MQTTLIQTSPQYRELPVWPDPVSDRQLVRLRQSVVIALLIGTACAVPPAPRAIHVVANDYAFATPETTPAGPTTFTLENRGAKFHEMFIGLLKPGATAAQIAATHQQGIGFRQLPGQYLEGDVTVALFASPGAVSPARVTVDLLGGRSDVIFCQLRDSLGAPQHAALGMFRVLRIE